MLPLQENTIMLRVIGVLVVFMGGAILAYFILSQPKALPILNPVDLQIDMVDLTKRQVGMGHRISDFNLVNQDGQSVSLATYRGRVKVVDFFFTTCPGICKTMNDNLSTIYKNFKDEDRMVILSHTVWPEVDSVPVLREYATKMGVRETEITITADRKVPKTNHSTHPSSASGYKIGQWVFLTGEKKELYRLARQSYFVAPDKDDPHYDHGSENDFVHTEMIALVDTVGRIRGYYDGTSEEEMVQLEQDIETLLKKG